MMCRKPNEQTNMQKIKQTKKRRFEVAVVNQSERKTELGNVSKEKDTERKRDWMVCDSFV